MDVDNDPVDQNLLLQFTRLSTTDRDDLVKQFEELIKVNGTTASFFLEMNNWNLQNAICSFLDYGTAHNLPVMSVEECCKQLNYENPRNSCVMWWTLRNDGIEPWPDNCSLQYASGNHRCDMKTIPVTHVVYPKHSTTVIYFTAPKEPVAIIVFGE
ncbi:hypothetical protein PGB90_000958 [Kerria lacca]